jgi:hypothetical protein
VSASSEPLTTPVVRLAGRVSTWTRSYGWINGDDGKRYFLHRANVLEDRLPEPRERVTFEADAGDGRSLVARAVRWQPRG